MLMIWRHVVLTAITLLCVQITNAQGIWSRTGGIPSVEAEARQNILAPDAKHFIRATRDGLRLGNSTGETLQSLPTAAFPPLWEVVWAPDSRKVAVNFSDGGAGGTWDADIFEMDSAGHLVVFRVSDLIRNAAKSFPICESPEDVNVALVGWSARGDAALLVAEVPPHSSCKNMGAVRGFMVSLVSKKIVQVMPESLLRRKWAKVIGERLLISSRK
jgi:hypothetical protein